MSGIRKAVIPAAGFGTRFLPATKSQPKEMLPIVDKPTIQYVVEEAVEAGITDILMIIGKGKRAIEEHFDRNMELEYQLEENSFVSITIFNHLGQAMTVLTDQRQTKGSYRVQWNAEAFPAGIYLCALKTDDGTLTKKIIKQH